MPIEFHCTHCHNLVRAPDNAGGRMGRCPYCQNQVYIATPPEQIEELGLEPVDEADRRRKRELEEEAKRVADSLLHERGEGDAGGEGAGEPAAAAAASAGGGTRGTIEEAVIAYLRAMKNSKLDVAEKILDKLRLRPEEAKRVAEGFATDPVPPPELADVPPNVLRGFLKSLVGQL